MNLNNIKECASYVIPAVILSVFTGGIGSAAVLGGVLFLTNKAVDVAVLSPRVKNNEERTPNIKTARISRIAIDCLLAACVARGIASAFLMITMTPFCLAGSLPATAVFLGETYIGKIAFDRILTCTPSTQAGS